MRIAAFKENEHASCVHKFFRLRVFLEQGQQFARGAHPVSADFSENLSECLRAGAFRRSGLQVVNADLLLRIAAVKRKEGGILQKQKTPRRVTAAMLPGKVERVCARDRVQRSDAGLPHQQLTRAVEKSVPDGLRRGAAVEQIHRLLARVHGCPLANGLQDRKSTRLNSSHLTQSR